jgi:hypothetical protein
MFVAIATPGSRDGCSGGVSGLESADGAADGFGRRGDATDVDEGGGNASGWIDLVPFSGSRTSLSGEREASATGVTTSSFGVDGIFRHGV